MLRNFMIMLHFIYGFAMKNAFSFFVISLFLTMNSISYASNPIPNKEKLNGVKKQQDKPKFRISERKVLKNKEKDEEVSNFSMEELRVGAQRPLDDSVIQYFKSQCRYAFMSDREIIANRCEVKKIAD